MSNLNNNTAQLEALLAKVNALPETVAQATPAITVNQTTGLITATATQIAGYVPAGTKSATHQLAFQPAKTITPGTANQTAVAANTYVGGAVTVAGDTNLKAENIVNGKTIFGVTGTATIGGGGDTSMEDGLITRQVTSYINDRVTTIGDYAFYFCSRLTTASFPNVTSIGNYAFRSCSSLTTVSFPNATSIGNNAFCYCSSLTTASFPNATYIGSEAFGSCSSLKSFYLMGTRVCSLMNSKAFIKTPIANWSSTNGGRIYVPASLVNAYKSATNWAYYSGAIVGI